MRFIRWWNDSLARWLILAMGTMWCVYLFVIWSILPLFFPISDAVVFWTSIIVQLAAFPVILLALRRIEQRLEMTIGRPSPLGDAQRSIDLSGIELRLFSIEQRISKLRAAPARKPRQSRTRKITASRSTTAYDRQ